MCFESNYWVNKSNKVYINIWVVRSYHFDTCSRPVAWDPLDTNISFYAHFNFKGFKVCLPEAHYSVTYLL